MSTVNTQTTHQVTKSELPVCCPPENADNLASLHPRVYLPLSQDNPTVECPYCSAKFSYKETLEQ